MDRDEIRDVRVCSIILKMADVMDRHRNRSVRGFSIALDKDVVKIRLSADEDPSMEMWSLGRIAPDFKKVFGLDLAIESDFPLKSA